VIWAITGKAPSNLIKEIMMSTSLPASTNHGDNARLEKAAAYSGEPWGPKNPYFEQAEASMDSLWDRLIAPFIARCDARMTVDLACGQGRNTRKLLPLVTEIIGLDYQKGNTDFCTSRFADEPKARFYPNNGFDLRPVADQWATLVYSFDAMVHFEPEVVAAYLTDIHRVLQPGGSAFLHHSNYTGGTDWRRNPASRNAMSAGRFAILARQAGFDIREQRVIPWGQHADLDCLTLLGKPLNA
jgi:SAM-dependent methyltransferase